MTRWNHDAILAAGHELAAVSIAWMDELDAHQDITDVAA